MIVILKICFKLLKYGFKYLNIWNKYIFNSWMRVIFYKFVLDVLKYFNIWNKCIFYLKRKLSGWIWNRF